MSAVITLNLPIFLAAVGVLLVLLILVSAFYRHPSRPCPNCGETVKLTSNNCPHCGYRFAFYTFRR